MALTTQPDQVVQIFFEHAVVGEVVDVIHGPAALTDPITLRDDEVSFPPPFGRAQVVVIKVAPDIGPTMWPPRNDCWQNIVTRTNKAHPTDHSGCRWMCFHVLEVRR